MKMERIIPEGGTGDRAEFAPSFECPRWAPYAFLAGLLFYPALILLAF